MMQSKEEIKAWINQLARKATERHRAQIAATSPAQASAMLDAVLQHAPEPEEWTEQAALDYGAIGFVAEWITERRGNAFFDKGLSQDELIEAARHGDLPGSLEVIGQLGTAIALLESRWDRPMSEGKSESRITEVIRLLRESQETVRKAHEAHCTKEMTQ